MMFLSFAKGLCVDDDLVFFVDTGHAVVALDGAFTGSHLRTFVIRDIALYFLFCFALPPPGAGLFEELFDLVVGLI